MVAEQASAMAMSNEQAMAGLSRVFADVTAIKGDLQRVDAMLREFESKLGVDVRTLQANDATSSARTDNLHNRLESLTMTVSGHESDKVEMVKK